MLQHYRRLQSNLLGRILAFMVLLPLFLTASFAYQAGNNFELTAGSGSNRTTPSSHTVIVSRDRHPSDTKALPPQSPCVDAVVSSLLIIYLLRIPNTLFHTPHVLQMKRQLLRPVKLTGGYVDKLREMIKILRHLTTITT
ncbi:hypothetical protein D3P08_01220 [Paenibacillus nanensis]|uniref:Uncharacterized protein n=1 Tax=Paenibacillus nanensis TaxID=393251 RepID=A0A3A1VH29_9BACL|nr:hypothetical protein [Paenibacillus nanensis]RIX60228.1 hypothetical protein D3P08_01220 [Paenibacillus nanensis]